MSWKNFPVPEPFESSHKNFLVNALARVPHLEDDSLLVFLADNLSPHRPEDCEDYEKRINQGRILSGMEVYMRFDYPAELAVNYEKSKVNTAFICPTRCSDLFLTGGRAHVVMLSPSIWIHSVSDKESTLYLEAPAFAATVKHLLLDRGYVLERAELRTDPDRMRSSNNGLGVHISYARGIYSASFMEGGSFYVDSRDKSKLEITMQTVKWYNNLKDIYGSKNKS